MKILRLSWTVRYVADKHTRKKEGKSWQDEKAGLILAERDTASFGGSLLAGGCVQSQVYGGCSALDFLALRELDIITTINLVDAK